MLLNHVPRKGESADSQIHKTLTNPVRVFGF
jgi:hypothetical protein